jgi:hypothetical protein
LLRHQEPPERGGSLDLEAAPLRHVDRCHSQESVEHELEDAPDIPFGQARVPDDAQPSGSHHRAGVLGQEVRGPDELDTRAARADRDGFAGLPAHAPTEEDDRGREVAYVGVEQAEEPRDAREPRDLVEGSAARIRVIAEVVRAEGRDHFHDRGVAPVRVQEDDAHARIQSL